MQLNELQSQFLHSLLADSEDVDPDIRANGLSPKCRLQIYRNNFTGVLIDALRSIYPKIVKIVGDAFFNHAADCYLHAYPSVSGDLRNYGKHFAEFISNFAPAQTLSYLPDIARLEWIYHEIFHAAEAPSLNLAELSKISADQYDRIYFYLHPACRLISSDFPLLQIWQLCEHEKNEIVDLNSGGIYLLVARRALEIYFDPITAAEFTFLQALQTNKFFSDACALALEKIPNFDVSACLKKRILDGTIIGFTVNL